MKIIISGDFTTEGRGKCAVSNGAAISGEIVSLLNTSDYNVVNLEAPVANDSHKTIQKSGPHLRTDAQTIKYLKDCGFHAVTLANNHFCDYGKEGVAETIETLDSCGMDFVGGGRNKKELRKPLFIENPDGVVAILNYCEHEFSVQDEYGSNPLDSIRVFYDIREVRSKADIVIVIVHGGSEEYQLPTPRMQNFYRYIIDIGADLVVNHHQHCYSGYEPYRNQWIYYGLGNFFFDDGVQTARYWNEGYMLGVHIEEKKIVDCHPYPYIQCLGSEVQVRLMQEEERQQFQKKWGELNTIIADEKQLEDSFRKLCKLKSKNYYSLFSPYYNRYLRYLCKRGLLPSFISRAKRLSLLNYIECEAHRDITIEVLRGVDNK